MPKINERINIDLRNKLGDKWELFEKLHKLILSLKEKVDFCIFPIYIRYSLAEKNIAIIYFRGKFVIDGSLDLGLNLNKKPKIKGFVTANYMKYPGITYSIKLKNIKDITPTIVGEIKSIKI